MIHGRNQNFQFSSLIKNNDLKEHWHNEIWSQNNPIKTNAFKEMKKGEQILQLLYASPIHVFNETLGVALLGEGLKN